MAAPSVPPAIDASEFARKGLAIHDTIALSKFPRLSDVILPSEAALDYRLSGRIDPQGKPRLHLQMQGEVPMTCQRCMEPLKFAVDVDTDFILVSDERMIPSAEAEEDLNDYLVAGPHIDVAELLEEELLLALPYAPKHEEECAERADLKMNTEKPSPFDVLKGLKTRAQD
jgi:uncharacterized protein